MRRYAQNAIDLYPQLVAQGYTSAEIGRFHEADVHARSLFAAWYRPSGKPFVDHAVGTASILASVKEPIALVTAGLLHAAYTYGNFGSGVAGACPENRATLRRMAGDEVEERVAAYTELRFDDDAIEELADKIDRADDLTRDVVTLALANELEDHLGLAVLYCSNGEHRRARLRHAGPRIVDLARAIGQPRLAAELERVFGETLEASVPAELRWADAPERVYMVVPRSHRVPDGKVVRTHLDGLAVVPNGKGCTR